MSAAAAAIAGGSLLGSSVLSAKGASKAAGAQSDAAQQAIALKREIFEKQQELLAPYVQLGTDVGLPGLQRLSTPEGQADYYRNYYQSPQFAAQADTARNQQLAASEATGGLQSTSTANQLARISPTLGLAALQNQQGLYGQLTNIGLSAQVQQLDMRGSMVLVHQTYYKYRELQRLRPHLPRMLLYLAFNTPARRHLACVGLFGGSEDAS